MDEFFRTKRRRKYFDLFFPLVSESSVNRAIVLMGPRRVGKTVILWQSIDKLIDKGVTPENILYLTLDDPLLHPFSLEDLIRLYEEIFDIKELTDCVIIFDEIQYLKGWDVQLKVLVDNYRECRFVVSGSAASALRRKSTESGAGRFTDFLLPPLTFYEYLDLLELTEELFGLQKFHHGGESLSESKISKLNEEFLKYLNYGGFPEAIFNKEIQKDPQRFIRSDILDKVLLRDLPSLYGIQDTQELNRFFSALVYQTGNEISYNALSKASGVSINTIKKYIEYLEAAFLIKSVPRINDTGKIFRRRNFFKVYLTNPSLYSAIYGPISEHDTTTLGSLVETAFFSQWMHAPRMFNRIHYARWSGGKGEVDMVTLGENFKPDHCFEIKWSDDYPKNPDKLKSLLYFAKKNPLNEYHVTTKTINKIILYKNIKIVFQMSAWACFSVGRHLIERTIPFMGSQD